MLNTHFDHVGTEARRNSALLIIDKIKEIAGTHPAMMTGDFNVSEEWEASVPTWSKWVFNIRNSFPVVLSFNLAQVATRVHAASQPSLPILSGCSESQNVLLSNKSYLSFR